MWFSRPSLSARLIIKRKTSEHSILWVEMTFTELGLHWRDFQQPISTSASTPPQPRVSGKDAHPIDGISIRSAGTSHAHIRGSVNNKRIHKGGFWGGGHVKVHSLAVRWGLHKRKKKRFLKVRQSKHSFEGRKNVTSKVPSHYRREVALQVWFSSPFMENGNGGERTHALEGLCPSKHTNNVVKGKHNNELIVLRECHNECESHSAQCF